MCYDEEKKTLDPSLTDSIRALCPKCTENIPVLTITDDETKVLIDCPCKYKEEIPIVDYIKQYKEHPDRKCTYQAKCEEHKQPLEYYCYTCNKVFCEAKQNHECRGFANYDRDLFDSWKMDYGYTLEEAKEREKKCEEFLDVYFPSLKEEFMKKEQSKEKIDKFNAAYSKAVERSKNVLQFSFIMFENYKTNNHVIYENYKNNCRMNMLKYYPDADTDSYINYFENFSFQIYRGSEQKDFVQYQTKRMLGLKSGRIAVATEEKTVDIIDVKNNAKVDMTIKLHGNVFSFCELDNGQLVTRSTDYVIKVWELAKDSYKCLVTLQDPTTKSENDIAALPGNRIIFGCDDDKTYIWDMNAPYKEKPIKVLDIPYRGYVLFKEKNWIFAYENRRVPDLYDPKVSFALYDMTTFEKIKEYDNKLFEGYDIYNDFVGCEVAKNCLLYQIKDGYHLFNVESGVVEDKVKRKPINKPTSFLKLRDNKTVLICMVNGTFMLFDAETKKGDNIYNGLNDFLNNSYYHDIFPIDNSSFAMIIEKSEEFKQFRIWKY